GRLPFLGSLDLTTDAPAGEPGGNSAFRLAAVHDRFAVPADMAEALRSLDGPVLLVDDLVDSRWTLTVGGRLLRQAGASGVLPFALAVAA
ncbi:MAG: ATP-dependent helicase RecQ, partial [Actinomycetota bacterium]|nr:ATP-dependent helicase RecQ [Actinomycetota bacterium]